MKTKLTEIQTTIIKVNSKLEGKKKEMYVGTVFIPKPLSMRIFRARGFNKEIGDVKKFKKNINPMEAQYGRASAKVLLNIENEEFIKNDCY